LQRHVVKTVKVLVRVQRNLCMCTKKKKCSICCAYSKSRLITVRGSKDFFKCWNLLCVLRGS